MLNLNKPAKGTFRHRETRVWFTYRDTTDPWALAHGLEHEIDVQGGVRYGTVLKTVAKVAVDENADGTPLIESWPIHHHQQGS